MNSEPICNLCDEPFPRKRADLGYTTCLLCGEKEASKEVERKKQCVAPAYNKGAYMYIDSVDSAKDIGR